MQKERVSKQVKHTAVHKQLLAIGANGDGPWCPVQFVKGIEVLGASLGSVIRIVVRDPERRASRFTYVHKGPGMKMVNIPRGEVQIQRIKGKEPLTITAYCGP